MSEEKEEVTPCPPMPTSDIPGVTFFKVKQRYKVKDGYKYSYYWRPTVKMPKKERVQKPKPLVKKRYPSQAYSQSDLTKLRLLLKDLPKDKYNDVQEFLQSLTAVQTVASSTPCAICCI